MNIETKIINTLEKYKKICKTKEEKEEINKEIAYLKEKVLFLEDDGK